MADGPFPNWDQMATRGDVIRAMVYCRAAMANLAGAAVQMRIGNDAAAKEKLDDYFESDRVLNALIHEIGGVISDG